MSRNASGNYTLPSPEAPFIIRTVVDATDMNTVMSDIGNEITQSLDRNGKGAMVAPLVVPTGSAAAPTLTFTGDTDTGIYEAAANTLGFSTGGTVRATLAAGQFLTIDGALATPALSFISDTNTGIYRAGADDLRIVTGGVLVAKATTKLSVSASTAATGATRQDALSLTNGDLDLSGVAYPTSTTAIANRLTPMNIPKALAVITIDGTSSPYTITVNAGFNITSVVRTTASTFTFTFASAFANTNYGVVGQAINGLFAPDMILFNPTTRNTGSMVAGLAKSSAGGLTIDAWGNAVTFFVAFFGEQ